MADILRTHVVPGGAAWSVQVARGRQVLFTALAGRPNVSLLVYAAWDRIDRMNVPDTLKAQYSACIAAPMVLMSDRGQALASVTGSSLPWHDALGGHSFADVAESSYAAEGNGWKRSARTGLLSELRKHGRDESDLHATVNLFSKVALDDMAGMSFVPGFAQEGDWVSLRSELDLLLVLSTCPHPLDTDWAPADVQVDITMAAPVEAEDASRLFRPESARALEQSEFAFL